MPKSVFSLALSRREFLGRTAGVGQLSVGMSSMVVAWVNVARAKSAQPTQCWPP
ncbi:twin-arginine translocation signal domain-containing protein [Roseovarius sp. THAF8]|uniref:twin-arginine translocation signal domain-containing protein n=1 Tax=unclassified Roseovarius TaxID=2614913 RepID=UPI0034A183D1